ncbi:MAG: L-threonylcarbamoyladenylate synthase [Granulosicoccaceae bacterium]|jgi:L-threonylcarbamoyladenylate synthase
MRAWPLHRAVAVLHAGGIVACPTEAVYGLSCDPLNADAVHTLLALKQRPVHKGLILVASNFRQLEPYLGPLAKPARERVLQSWPGPHTWLWPAREDTPAWLTGTHDTLAVRVTAHPLMATLCDAFGGALVSSSANLAGQRPARTALEVRTRFNARIDVILHGRTGGAVKPSTIRDARSNKILRA